MAEQTNKPQDPKAHEARLAMTEPFVPAGKDNSVRVDDASPTVATMNPQAEPGHVARTPEHVLLSSTPMWLNWTAVTLAVLIVAGIFLLSARQLNAPQPSVNAGQTPATLPAAVGGMALDADAPGGNQAETGEVHDNDGGLAHGLEPGMMLVNPGNRVSLFADASRDANFLDSYARGGTFVVLEPSGDFEAYPVVIEDVQWVRVRAVDGLVGWTPLSNLETAP